MSGMKGMTTEEMKAVVGCWVEATSTGKMGVIWDAYETATRGPQVKVMFPADRTTWHWAKPESVYLRDDLPRAWTVEGEPIA